VGRVSYEIVQVLRLVGGVGALSPSLMEWPMHERERQADKHSTENRGEVVAERHPSEAVDTHPPNAAALCSRVQHFNTSQNITSLRFANSHLCAADSQ